MQNSIPDILRVSPADPDPGANLLFLLPNNFYYKLISFKFRLVTDSTVISRFLTLEISDGGDELFWTQLTTTIAASQTKDIFTAPFGTTPPNTSAGQIGMPWPIDIYLKPNWNFTTTIVNLQAADQISDIQIALERWAVRNV